MEQSRRNRWQPVATGAVYGVLRTGGVVAARYIEFGQGRVGSVDIDLLSRPTRTGTFHVPSAALAAEKAHFGSSRPARWFGS